MLEMILENLKLIAFAVGLLGISMFSNTCFGLWYNIKILKNIFKVNILLFSLLKFFMFSLGLASLSVLITLLPMYAKYSGVEMAEEFYTTITIAIIIAVFIKTIIKYTKQSFEKLNNILDGSGN